MKSSEKTQYIKHIRSSHFSLTLACILLLFSNYFTANTVWSDALKELNFINDLLKKWDFQYIESLAVKSYERKANKNATAPLEGELTLSIEGDKAYIDSPFTISESPLVLPFAAKRTSLLSGNFISNWEALSINSEKYKPLKKFIYSNIYGDEIYTHVDPPSYSLPLPSNIVEFEDLWNILDLEHSLLVADIENTADGFFVISKYNAYFFGEAALEKKSDQCIHADCGWLFQGGLLRPINKDFFLHGISHEKWDGSLMQYIETPLNENIIELVNFSEKSMRNDFLFLSLDRTSVPNAGLGGGWLSALNGSHPSKDFSVHANVGVPVEIERYSFHAQNLLIEQLPEHYPHKDNIIYGEFKDSFPALSSISQNLGFSIFTDIERYLKERIKLEGQSFKVPLTGIDIPTHQFILFGSLIVFIFQLYYYLHFQYLHREILISEKAKNLNEPWVGLYTESVFAKLLLAITTAILPPAAILLSCIYNLLPWYQYLVLLFSIPVSYKLLQLYIIYWRNSSTF